MNIMFICDEYPPGPIGGIGTVVQILSRELVKQGHGVFVVGLYAHYFGQREFEIDQGVKVWRFRYGINLYLPFNNKIHKIFNRIPGLIKRHLNGKKAFSHFISFVQGTIRKEKVDIIEIADFNTFAMRIGFKVKWPKFTVPLVVKSHGSYTYFAHEMHETPKSWLVEIDQELMERADALSAVSLYTAEQNKKIFNISREIKVLYNGIDLPEIFSSDQKRNDTVIFTGTLLAKKGIFQLMKAWNLVHKVRPEAVLEVYGKGDKKKLIAMLEESARQTVHFKGHVKRSDLLKTLSSATLAIFPSYSECFALAPMEAMAVGCPVIYTKRSSGSELISPEVNGSLIDPDDVKQISEEIIKILTNEDLQHQYAVEGKKTIHEKFVITKVAQAHVAYYNTVIDNFKMKNLASVDLS